MSDVLSRLQRQIQYDPPVDFLQIKTIDLHTGGEPLRVIVDGYPEIKGNNVLERRRYCKEALDHLRTALMYEPRGHADMYGCLLVPPNDEAADFGIIFMHNEGYSTMCGHAIIAISVLAAEMGWVELKGGVNELKIDAPCGRITSFIRMENGKAQGVSFHCVPSFVVGLDRAVEVAGLGQVIYDLAYGGAFYAYVDINKNQFDFDLSAASYQQLIRTGMDIKRAVMLADPDIQHPFEEDLSFLYGTIFIDNGPQPSGVDSRNICIFAEGEVDRCPTGSGVSGRMAIHKQRGEINYGERMSIESITGSIFYGSIVSEEDFGPYTAVIPQVEGTAHITGQHCFLIDPKDPMKAGFLLR